MTRTTATAGHNLANILDVKFDADALSDDIKTQHGVRFPGLDANSQQDFIRGFKIWVSSQGKGPDDVARTERFLKANGHTTGNTDMSYEEAWELLRRDPVHAARLRLGWTIHDMMWDRAQRAFDADRDGYLAAMEATDDAGPGSLELNPDLDIPAYARHEIHRQPGGFVGNDFAGWLYHYCLTLSHYLGHSDHDEAFFRISQKQPLPDDGQVHNILDIGCGPGQLTTAFKQRFPVAEVWGIDVGGPMVRYAHHRAAKMGIDVHFAQRLAEDNRFPDDHFDIVADYLVFHEMTMDAARRVIAEIFRTLRPGGVFGHLDAPTTGHPTKALAPTIINKAMLWNVYRHNYEPFYIDYAEFDLPKMLTEAGFVLDFTGGPVLWNGRPIVLAKKPG